MVFIRKRGVSNIVVVVLIMLLIVAAVSIIWTIVFKTTKEASSEIEVAFSCDEIDMAPIECVYNNTNNYGVFKVIFSGENILKDVYLIFNNKNGDSTLKYIDGTEVNNFETSSFLFYSDNILNNPLNFKITASILDSNGNLHVCPNYIEVACNLPSSENPKESPISEGGEPTYHSSGGGGGGSSGGGGYLTRINPPIISEGIPSGVLSAGTTSVVLQVATDKNALCRYSTIAGTSYDLGTDFDNTVGLIHNVTINNLENGNEYNYYIRCSSEGMANSDDYAINFSVDGFIPPPTSTLEVVNIDSCGKINESNKEFRLNNDILSHVGTCFSITKDNIILNGNGYKIDGDDSGVDFGIYAYSVKNITIKNFAEISDFGNVNNGAGIYLNLILDSKITDLNSSSNYEGMRIWYSDNNLMSNLMLNGNKEGFNLMGSLNNTITGLNVTRSNSTGHQGAGLILSAGSDDNNFFNIISAHNKYEGVRIWDSANNSFYGLNTSFNMNGIGVYTASNITLNNVFSEQNSQYGLILSSSTVFADGTYLQNGLFDLYCERISYLYNRNMLYNTESGCVIYS